MRKIRASELGAWAYCQRAWGYERQGKISANQAQLQAGSLGHARHAAGFKASMLLKTLAILALLGAVLLAILQVLK